MASSQGWRGRSYSAYTLPARGALSSVRDHRAGGRPLLPRVRRDRPTGPRRPGARPAPSPPEPSDGPPGSPSSSGDAASRLDPSHARGTRGALSAVQQSDIDRRGRLPGMPERSGPPRRGRRGRRTGAMIRVARGRISDLFGLAEQEARAGRSTLSDRYVQLARRIGTRYNVRLLVEYRGLYCRGCSTYWVEGRTLRTRLRGAHRTQTCLRCGRIRRVQLRAQRPARAPLDSDRPGPIAAGAPVLVEDAAEGEFEGDEGEEE